MLASQADLEAFELLINAKVKQDQRHPETPINNTLLKIEGRIETPLLDSMPNNTGEIEVEIESIYQAKDFFFQVKKLNILGDRTTQLLQNFLPLGGWYNVPLKTITDLAQQDSTEIEDWQKELEATLQTIAKEIQNLKQVTFWEKKSEMREENGFYVADIATNITFLKPQLEASIPTLIKSLGTNQDISTIESLKGEVKIPFERPEDYVLDTVAYDQSNQSIGSLQITKQENEITMTLNEIPTNKSLTIKRRGSLTLITMEHGELEINMAPSDDKILSFNLNLSDTKQSTNVAIEGHIDTEKQVQVNGQLRHNDAEIGTMEFFNLMTPLKEVNITLPAEHQSFETWLNGAMSAFFGGGLSFQTEPSDDEVDFPQINTESIQEDITITQDSTIEISEPIKRPVRRRPIQPITQ